MNVRASSQLIMDQTANGSGVTITSNTTGTQAGTVTISAACTGAAVTAVRQSYIYAPYIPGISKLMLFAGVIAGGGPTTGTVGSSYARLGCWDGSNGLYWSYDYLTGGNTPAVNIMRLGVVTRVAQAAWNGNKLGAGDVTVPGVAAPAPAVDFTKSQVFWIDQEWLGVGSVRFGVVINDEFIVCHTFTNYNGLTAPYTPLPNAPIRYEARCAASGSTVTLYEGCSSVQLEIPDAIPSISTTELGFATPVYSSVPAAETAVLAIQPTTGSYFSGDKAAIHLHSIGAILTSLDTLILRLYKVFTREGAAVGSFGPPTVAYFNPQVSLPSNPSTACLVLVSCNSGGTTGVAGSFTPGALLWTGGTSLASSSLQSINVHMGVALTGQVDQLVLTATNIGSGTYNGAFYVNWTQET
jgi:hypothetical protein